MSGMTESFVTPLGNSAGVRKEIDITHPYFLSMLGMVVLLPMEELPKLINDPVIGILAKKQLENPDALTDLLKIKDQVIEYREKMMFLEQEKRKYRELQKEAEKAINLFFNQETNRLYEAVDEDPTRG